MVSNSIINIVDTRRQITQVRCEEASHNENCKGMFVQYQLEKGKGDGFARRVKSEG